MEHLKKDSMILDNSQVMLILILIFSMKRLSYLNCHKWSILWDQKWVINLCHMVLKMEIFWKAHWKKWWRFRKSKKKKNIKKRFPAFKKDLKIDLKRFWKKRLTKLEMTWKILRIKLLEWLRNYLKNWKFLLLLINMYLIISIRK